MTYPLSTVPIARVEAVGETLMRGGSDLVRGCQGALIIALPALPAEVQRALGVESEEGNDLGKQWAEAEEPLTLEANVEGWEWAHVAGEKVRVAVARCNNGQFVSYAPAASVAYVMSEIADTVRFNGRTTDFLFYRRGQLVACVADVWIDENDTSY